MKTNKKLTNLTVAIAAAAGAVVGVQTPAHAGSSGQQIIFIDNGGNIRSFLITGTAWNGAPSSGCFQTQGWRTAVSGWWWQGDTTILPNYSDNCTTAGVTAPLVHAYIDKSSRGDWWAVPDATGWLKSGAKQIDFFDNQHRTNSMYVQGTNQDGNGAAHCVSTPGYETVDSNWWWKDQVHVSFFQSGDCSGTKFSDSYLTVAGFSPSNTLAIVDR
ncbi:hypothetical protein GCM10009839_22190 [Catenulispora yoronensis]|uniref:Secreted protein n=1 Tax=Catenulispora yoronensis TaxID=450799 RepID=A0ABN2TYN3_9ACTN